MVSENKTWKLRTHLMSYPPCDMKVCPAKSSITFNAHTRPTKSLIFTKITVLISQNMEKMSLTETINLITSHCMDPSKKKKRRNFTCTTVESWLFESLIFQNSNFFPIKSCFPWISFSQIFSSNFWKSRFFNQIQFP